MLELFLNNHRPESVPAISVHSASASVMVGPSLTLLDKHSQVRFARRERK